MEEIRWALLDLGKPIHSILQFYSRQDQLLTIEDTQENVFPDNRNRFKVATIFHKKKQTNTTKLM